MKEKFNKKENTHRGIKNLPVNKNRLDYAVKKVTYHRRSRKQRDR